MSALTKRHRRWIENWRITYRRDVLEAVQLAYDPEATGFGGTCKCMREPAAMLLTGLGAFLVLLLSKNRVVIYVFFACAAGLRGLCASFASTQQR